MPMHPLAKAAFDTQIPLSALSERFLALPSDIDRLVQIDTYTANTIIWLVSLLLVTYSGI